MNTTIVAAELFGYYVLALLVLPHMQVPTLIGVVGIFCIFGIASTWRIRPESTDNAKPQKLQK